MKWRTQKAKTLFTPRSLGLLDWILVFSTSSRFMTMSIIGYWMKRAMEVDEMACCWLFLSLSRSMMLAFCFHFSNIVKKNSHAHSIDCFSSSFSFSYTLDTYLAECSILHSIHNSSETRENTIEYDDKYNTKKMVETSFQLIF